MPVISPVLDLTGTKLVNFFYPYLKQTEVNICFTPIDLINRTVIQNYLSTFKYTNKEGENKELNVSEIGLFMNIFSKDNPAINNILNITTGTSKGVEENQQFVWIKHTYDKELSTETFLNFIYYKEDSFYAINPQAFRSQLRSSTLDEKTKKIDREVLEELIKLCNKNDIKGWKEILNFIHFKSSVITISKILISLFPYIPMNGITTLSDFIKSEILSNKEKTKPNSNILELKGDLITYFYNSHNYHNDNGPLGCSCMKNHQNTEQIKFYANNPTNVSLLTYIKDKKLLARAVLWTTPHGKKYIDRIYYSSSNYANDLVAYCKQNNIDTVYSSNTDNYGLSYSNRCVVKLDTFEMAKNNYPYLDSMCAIDIIGSYIAPDYEVLTNYLNSLGSDYLIKNLNRSGYVGYDRDRQIFIQKNKNRTHELKFPKDINGNSIDSSLNNYALVNKPSTSLVSKKEIVTINGNCKVEGKWCEKNIIEKYNSLRPTLLYNNKTNIYNIEYYDKQYVTYSTYHKCYIRNCDVFYISVLKTNVIKDVTNTAEFHNTIRLLKLRKMYSNKLVNITYEGLSEIKEQVKLLPFKESLIDMRKSRVYNINTKNIFSSGVKIKGIMIPFKHLRFVKHESN